MLEGRFQEPVSCQYGGMHAVHSTASWTRSEGIWVGPDFPFPDGWYIPHDHRPAHSRGLSKPIKPTGQALTLINPFHKRHYYIILTLQKIILFCI